MKTNTALRPLFLSAALWLAAVHTAAATQAIRIDHPQAQDRQLLADQAIDYGAFLWLSEPADALNNLSSAARTQYINDAFHLRVGDQTLDPLDGVPDDFWLRDHAGGAKDFYLLQMRGPMKSEWLRAMRAAGLQPLKTFQPYAQLVWADAAGVQAFATAHRAARWGGPFFPALRLQSSLRDLGDAPEPTMALVHRDAAEALSDRLQQLQARGVSVRPINRDFSALMFYLSGNKYTALATTPGVLTVQRIQQDAGPRGEMSQQSIVGNYDGGNIIATGYQTWLSATGLTGAGITVGVVDGGVYNSHPDLSGSVVNCTGPGASCSDSVNSHGTHVAGAIGGTAASGTVDPNGFLRGLGVAPGVTLLEQRYGPLLGAGPGGMVPGGMLEIYKDSAVNGALLTNNSWGPTGSPQGYDIPTMEVDMISRDADPDTPGPQPVLAVWSIMNGNGDSFGACSPSSLGSPDEAKNLFAVGSTKLQNGSLNQTTDIFDVSGNSAHGPACDGRLVPHIVAPGCSTDAPDSASGYGTKCGTSMASPVVSGSVSLFWQRFKAQNGVDPSPALIKAVFTAVAMNLSGFRDADGGTLGNRPDRKQGWGRIDLDAVINPTAPMHHLDQSHVFTASGQQWTAQLQAVNPSLPVRIMLVWTDAPGAGLGGTSQAWVNDLDLSVSAGGDTYLGNVFGVDAFSETGGSADAVNNMEGAFLRPDQHNGGLMTLNVLAANIADDALDVHNPTTPRQDFALVCYNCAVQLTDLIWNNGFNSSPFE